MASPQKENGYTPIANELLEAFLLYRFPLHTDSPTIIWLFVARKTYGYSKPEDAISLTQFEKGTGLPRKTVVYWLNYLVTALLLVKKEETKKGFVYAINKDYETWKPLVTARLLVTARSYSSYSTVTKTSYSTVTHINKKQLTKTRTFFKIPTLEELASYCSEIKSGVDPNGFLDYYTANGWLVGKNKMKDWKATVRNWNRKQPKINILEQDAKDIVAKYGQEHAMFKFLKNHTEEELLKVKHIIDL